MFFIEGPKVLYRLALSALKLFSSVSQNLGMFPWMIWLCYIEIASFQLTAELYMISIC